ncbi:uncharacterized protein LOC141588820 [Silene latifolia]|uniref:uncharacterized protein LOC141588820 n=1 Tax=Silene latifolia TaxID=37657 RepID=UPI003D76D3AA
MGWQCSCHTIRKGQTVSGAQTAELIREVTDSEIYEALVSIPSNKSPGLDGYTSQFYKDAYKTVGKDVIKAAITTQLVAEMNFRHAEKVYVTYTESGISHEGHELHIDTDDLYNSEYEGLSQNEASYEDFCVANKNSEDFMAIKLDMAKAYDRVEWKFLERVLVTFGFDRERVARVLSCVSTVSWEAVK